MNRVEEHVHAHLHEPIGVEALAELAGCSRYHFSRLFLTTTGETPQRYVTRLRVERAAVLPTTTEWNAEAIALRVGFAGARSLSRAMRRVLGASPGEVRASARVSRVDAPPRSSGDANTDPRRRPAVPATAVSLVIPRSLTGSISEAMADTPVVCLLGPRQCGKSTLATRLDPDRLFVSLDESRYLDVASADPDGFVRSLPRQVTIDEVQRSPGILRAIKRSVDLDREPGRFLLTGSANLLLLRGADESLAGRMEIERLQPLTESEKERSPGGFLRALLEGAFEPTIRGERGVGGSLADRLLVGGYPEAARRAPTRAREWHREYVRSIVERDVRDVAKVKDADEVRRLLELLAIRTGELQNTSVTANELKLSHATVERYVQVLERLFLVRRLPSWQRNHAKRVIKAAKLHVVDSGLAATLSGLDGDSWRDERGRMGHLLESFVLQQLVAQSGWTDSDLRFHHYRDKDKVEVDIVITRGTSTWGIEVKAAAAVSSRDGRGLRRLAALCGAGFRGGVVLYDGGDTLPLGDGLMAVPMRELWTR